MLNEKLIKIASELINYREYGNSSMGSVACALVSEKGNTYTGVCIDTSSGMGFCAEHTAISQMITHGEYVISRIVAVKKDEVGDTFVLAPCGRCREFMRQINVMNLETDVVLDKDRAIKLIELLPLYDWKKKQE